MERLDYEDKPAASVAEDFWKGKASEKGKSVFRRQSMSHQEVEVIVQHFSSNYTPPPSKKERVDRGSRDVCLSL